MSMTEAERHEFYELAKNKVSDRYAELMIKAVPAEPDRLATKDDLAVLGGDLRAEIAHLRTELKTEMADVRTELKTEMAHLRTDLTAEMRDRTGEQTRTIMLGLVGSISTLAVTQLVIAAIG